MDKDPIYEYKTLTKRRMKDEDLNKLSEEGWELFSSKRRTVPLLFTPTDYVFRRVKKDAEPEI